MLVVEAAEAKFHCMQAFGWTSPSPCPRLCLLSPSLCTSPGVFLICWLPFFVTHILNTHCRTCYVPPGLYGAFTWLGYVNSALNPVIYTTFNIEFRRAFIKILSCWGNCTVPESVLRGGGTEPDPTEAGKFISSWSWSKLWEDSSGGKRKCIRQYGRNAIKREMLFLFL